MNWGQLFFKFDGRLNRAPFWIAALIFAVDQYRPGRLSVT